MTPTIAFLDVNETLSDLAPLRERFEQVGAPGDLMPTWFAATLRDGIALTASGDYAPFQDVARGNLHALLAGSPQLRMPLDEAAEHVLTAMGTLSVHPDVPEGIRLLRETGMRVVTLTNGAPAIAQGLLARAGLDDLVERTLGVEEAGRWKPAPEPYRHACRTMGVEEEDAVLIAVHPWDVHGAKRAGLQAGWIDRDGRPYPDVFARPDGTGVDLPALVRELVG